jgi:hypothetical protein
MANHQKPELKPVTTQEIVDAIQELIDIRVMRFQAQRDGDELPQSVLDAEELDRRTIADGLRYHSAAKGVVVGEQ